MIRLLELSIEEVPRLLHDHIPIRAADNTLDMAEDMVAKHDNRRGFAVSVAPIWADQCAAALAVAAS
jgi:hypothetical protein